MRTLVAVGTEFDVQVRHSGFWELGIFDGDTGKDGLGNITTSAADGNWDHPYDAVATQLFYRLYADPAGSLTYDDIAGPDGVIGTGDEPVSPLYVWPGNDLMADYPNNGVQYFTDRPGGWPDGNVQMVDNHWFGITLPQVGAAETSTPGEFRYRLRVDLEFPMTKVESSFKLRSTGLIGPRANRTFQVIAPLRRWPDVLTVYPHYMDYEQYGESSPFEFTTYDGTWSLFMYVPDPQVRLDIWEGDFDFGPDGENQPRDTDDPDSPEWPFFIEETGCDWEAGSDPFVLFDEKECVPEAAQDAGQPPDDHKDGFFRREVTSPGPGQVRYDVNYRGPDSAAAPVVWSVANDNPSGNKEWEKFTLSTVGGCESTDDIDGRCDYEVAALPAGFYEIAIEGLDLSNIIALRLPFDSMEIPYARLGDYVWYDAGPGPNHLQDGWESGISGVNLELWLDNGDGSFDPALDMWTGLTDTTDSSGYYLFDDLFPGDYFVVIPPEETTVGGTLFGLSTSTPDWDGSDQTNLEDGIDSDGHIPESPGGTYYVFSHLVSLGAGEEDLTIDFGFTGFGGGSSGYLGNQVWLDFNENGVYEPDLGELGINGAVIQVYWDGDLSGTVSAGDFLVSRPVTGDGFGPGPGEYYAAELPDGQYLVFVDDSNFDPGGALHDFTQTHTYTRAEGGDHHNRKSGFVATLDFQAQINSDVWADFGFIGYGEIGDFVWHDENQDGIQDGSELGIDGVVITLHGDLDGDGQTDFTLTDTTTTVGGVSGSYLFTGLPLGTYNVELDASNFNVGGALFGYMASPTLAGGDDALDSNNNPTAPTTLTFTASSDRTLDFGFFIIPGKIGNQLWCETDDDGVYQTGDADNPPLAGVLVKLLDENGIEVASQTTAEDGTYLFEYVDDGTYEVEVDASSSVLDGLFRTVLGDELGPFPVSQDHRNRLSPYGVTLAGGEGAGDQNELGADFGYRPELCFQDPTDPDNGATIAYWIDDVGAGSGTVTIRVMLARTFADTAYGPNSTATGWPGKKGRKFDQIVGSDNLELTLTNGDGAVAMRFAMDLLAKDESTDPPTYRTGGIKQGPDAGLRRNDGSISVGSAAHVLGVRTSISENLNNTTWTDLTNSPLVDANYVGTETPPGWEWDTWYEVTVDLAAFGNSGFGDPSITNLHSSPSKTGEEKPDVEPCPSACPGDEPQGDDPPGGQNGGGEGAGTGTPGYWKNHPEAWPVDEIIIGGATYTKAEAIDGMDHNSANDKTYTMFQALVAAKLNVLIGNESSCVDVTIADADAWMAANPLGSKVKGSSDAWETGEPLYLKLDDYNNGKLCAPHRG